MARVLTRSAKDYQKFVTKYLPDIMRTVVSDILIKDCPVEYKENLILEMEKYGFSINKSRQQDIGLWFTRD